MLNIDNSKTCESNKGAATRISTRYSVARLVWGSLTGRLELFLCSPVNSYEGNLSIPWTRFYSIKRADHAGITLYRLLSYHRLPVYPISGAPECLLRLIARKGRRENLDALWALSRQPSRFSTTNVGTYGSTPDYRPILDSTDRIVLTDGALAQIQSDTLFIRTDKFWSILVR